MRRVLCLAGSLALAMALALPPVAGAPAANAQESIPPTFWVSQDFNDIYGSGWTAAGDVTVTAHDPEAGAGPDIVLTLATNDAGYFQGTQVFPGLQPGWLITVTDSSVTKTHTVGRVSITVIDPGNGTVAGTAGPFSNVHAGFAEGPEAGIVPVDHGIWTTADSSGQWSINLAGLTGLDVVGALQVDDDGDFTYTVRVKDRKFWVSQDCDCITGGGWPAASHVTVTAHDPEAGAGPDIVLTLATNGEGSFQGSQVFPGLQPGWLITVTDGVITKTHTVRDISITDVDPAADTMRGTADPSTEVYAGGVGYASGVYTNADTNGVWSVDVTGVFDIRPGSEVAVNQTDEDGDFTYIIQQVELASVPPGTSLTTPSRGTVTSGTPTVYWRDPLTVSTTGCPGGTGTAALTVFDGSGYTETIPLGETAPSSGAYTGTFAEPYPHHGTASILIAISGCSAATSSGFDFYIDPSGVVRDTFGNPVVGATVTLYRADDADGPFVAVPDGSAIMSPGNRMNPDLTGAGGLFGWDVTAGYYKVQAEKAGCSAPGGGAAFVETGVLTIPPPVIDLALVLYCAVNHAPSGADKAISLSANGTYTFSASDFGFTDPNDSPPNAFMAVIVTTLPSQGSLKLGAVPVTAGQPIPLASIPTMTFTPAAYAGGSPYATFTFQVQDNGGVANGGVDLDQIANTITLNVTGSGGTKLAFGVQPSSEQAGSAITPTITVRVLSASNALVSTDNTTVITLSIGTNPNGGTLSGTLVRTAINGVATFPGLSIDKVGKGYRLAASAPSLTGATSNAFNITPGPAVSLRVAGYPSPTNAFVSHTFTVTALDAFGNTATHYTGTVHFTSNDGTAVLPGNYHFNSFDNGVETFSATFRTWSPPNRTITATDVSRPSTNGTQSGIVVSAPTIQHITISPAGSTIRAGGSSSYTVTAYDSPSHSLGAVPAALSISPDGSCGGSSCTATMAGAHTVTATYGGKTATAKLNVTSGPAAGIVFGQQPTNTISNQTISPAVTVRVVDAYGNLVTSGGYLVSIGIGSNPSRGTLSGTTLRFTSGGVATFNTLAINRTGSGYRLVARAPFLATATSSSFNITP